MKHLANSRYAHRDMLDISCVFSVYRNVPSALLPPWLAKLSYSFLQGELSAVVE